MLQNLQLIFFLINSFIKRFKKVFMGYFTMYYIIVYCSVIIINALEKIGHSVEFWIFKSWLT